MADTETSPFSPMQSTTTPEQNASEGIPGPTEQPKTLKNGHIRQKPAHLWNSETASIAGRKGALTKARRYADRCLPGVPVKPEPQPPNPRLDLVREQIALTRKILNDIDCNYCPECKRSGMEPHHRAALLRALDSLLDRERIMLGIPGVGTLKPQGPSRRRPLGPVEPQPAEPVPAPISPPNPSQPQ